MYITAKDKTFYIHPEKVSFHGDHHLAFCAARLDMGQRLRRFAEGKHAVDHWPDRAGVDQFRKSLGIVPTMLTRRLASLMQEGLLEKHRYSDSTREEYLLTDAGRDLLPVLLTLTCI